MLFARLDETHLVGNVWPGICDVPTRLCENALVVVAVEEGILDIALLAVLASRRRADAVRLEAGLFENDEKPTLAGGDSAFGNVRLNGKHVRIGDNRQGVVRGRRHLASL